jgi:RimJ/RimL family protein N-acetyltransferase
MPVRHAATFSTLLAIIGSDQKMRATSTAGNEVVLRRATVADAELLVVWRAEPGMVEHVPGEPRSIDDVRSQLAIRSGLVIGPTVTGATEWIIDVDGEPSGRIRLSIESRSHKIGSLGYGLTSRHRGKGIVSAAVRLVTDLAFDPKAFDLERVEAIASVENLASRRVLAQSGFQFEGILRGYLIIRGKRVDHAIYGRLKTDQE